MRTTLLVPGSVRWGRVGILDTEFVDLQLEHATGDAERLGRARLVPVMALEGLTQNLGLEADHGFVEAPFALPPLFAKCFSLSCASDGDREILLMRYSGFSYKEIAEAVEVANTSVGTLLARAERRFAEAMTGAGEPV